MAGERHRNGDRHIHVYWKLGVRGNWRDSRFADLIHNGEVYHGNYQGCRSSKNVLRYCTKDDDYLSNIDVGGLLGRTSTRRRVCKKLLDGERLSEIVRDLPEVLHGYRRLK